MPQQSPANLEPQDRTVSARPSAWYKGVTGYQWLILVIASAGWIFDVYEGQIFNLTRKHLLTEILHGNSSAHGATFYGDLFLGIFLLGGTAGGLLFGSLADRIGRKPAMAATILVYSFSTGLTYFAHTLGQVAVLRFIVAMGVGGEWAVAASLVAEVFPANARAHASGIFHATSVLGTWLATLAGMVVGANWRAAYLVGVVPALLVAWVIASVKEPEAWKKAGEKVRDTGQTMGSLKDLLTNPFWAKRAFLGFLLAAIGLGTFWAITVAGQDLARSLLVNTGISDVAVEKKSQFAYGIVETIGGGLGLLSFGPLSTRFGRKRAFVLMLIGAAVIVPITCYGPKTYGQLLIVLPIFGFLTLGMHAGFAIYFPELFPTYLRATGASFCFNVGRALAGGVLFLSGVLKTQIPLRPSLCLLAALFLLGLVVIHFLPETKDQPLPD